MAQSWVKLVPVGEFPHPSGVTQVIDGEALAGMARTFDASRKTLVDFDHYSDLRPEQRAAVEKAGVLLPSEAAGWVQAVQVRGDGLYGDVSWTPRGQEALGNKAYRFLSPLWLRRDCQDAGAGRVRPLRLESIGLTNEPNIKAIPALANRDAGASLVGPSLDVLANRVDSETTDSGGAGQAPEGNANMEKIAALLGLDAKASEEDILAAIEILLQSAAEAKDGAEAMENRCNAAEAELSDLRGKAAEAKADATLAALESEGVSLANRDDARAALILDHDGALKLMRSVVPEPALANRAAGKTPESVSKSLANRAKIEGAIADYCRQHPGAMPTQAFAALQVSNPDLFKD